MIRRFWYILGTGVHVCAVSPAEGRVFPGSLRAGRAGAGSPDPRAKKGKAAPETEPLRLSKKVVIPISSAHYSAPRAGFAGCALYAPAGVVA